ncbi:MAG: M20 family metallopeptidase [Oscillospiraceae bacterium]
MPDYLKRAFELDSEILEMRRYLHQNPEVGNELPKTTAYIKKKLTEYGCEFEEICKGGIVANIGNKKGKTVLIRGDIDALPHKELSGEPFASTNGYSHSCGHDIHTASLLTCAKMLKETESELLGNVKLCFQPDEESINGALSMIAAGVMENPHVDAAISMHTNLPLMAGSFNVLPGTYLSSSDIFRIEVIGKAAHGSAPENGLDPINIATKIVDAVQTISTREVTAFSPNVITFGSIHGGDAPNIIPDSCVLTGTIRNFKREPRDYVKSRFVEIVKGICSTFRAEVKVEFTSQTPTTYNNPQLTEKLVGYLREMAGEDRVFMNDLGVKGSDDFAYFSELVPGVMYHVGMGTLEEGYTYGLHNPRVRFDERALPYSAAAFAHITYRWTQDNR